MPRHCSATACKSRDNKEARLAGITFHRLPKKGNPRRTAWIVNARRKGPGGKGLWEPQSDYIYFCSKHFTPESFELSGINGYRRLKDDAVPMLVEMPSGQKGKSSRGRGKTRSEDRQLSPPTKPEKDRSDRKETTVAVAVVHVVGEDKAETVTRIQREDRNENPPLSLPSQEPAPDRPTDVPSTPPSPSRYMRRLPPPPGFYLAKEHSYALLCPLEWRKRYEKITDSLEKSLRLLRAARRRENRLRLALLRLQESRLKQTLSQVQDRRKESHKIQGGSGQGRESGKPARSGQDRVLEGMDENEMEGPGEEMELLAEESWRKGRAGKLRDGVDDEEGCCFYCGRGREDEAAKEGDHVTSHGNTPLQGGRGRGRGRNVSNALRETVRSAAESKVQSKPPALQNIDPEQLTLLHPQPEMLLHMHALPGPSQSSASFQDVTSSSPQLQHLHLLQPDLSLLHPDTSAADIGATQNDDGGGGMCHVFWVPVSSETKEKNRIGVESAIPKSRSVLVAEETFQHAAGEEGAGLNVQSDDPPLRHPRQRVHPNDQQTNIRASFVGGDVTQKLKEHLEGFQLQLSSEFIQ